MPALRIDWCLQGGLEFLVDLFATSPLPAGFRNRFASPALENQWVAYDWTFQSVSIASAQTLHFASRQGFGVNH